MADDIVSELIQRCAGQGRTRELMTEAADEIERLRAELNSTRLLVQYLNDRLADFEGSP